MKGKHCDTRHGRSRHSRYDLCRARGEAGDAHGALAEGSAEGCAHQDRCVRRLRHRPAHSQRPLAEAAAVAVHARARACRRHRGNRVGAHQGPHGQAHRRRLEAHAAAADALWFL